MLWTGVAQYSIVGLAGYCVTGVTFCLRSIFMGMGVHYGTDHKADRYVFNEWN